MGTTAVHNEIHPSNRRRSCFSSFLIDTAMGRRGKARRWDLSSLFYFSWRRQAREDRRASPTLTTGEMTTLTIFDQIGYLKRLAECLCLFQTREALPPWWWQGIWKTSATNLMQKLLQVQLSISETPISLQLNSSLLPGALFEYSSQQYYNNVILSSQLYYRAPSHVWYTTSRLTSSFYKKVYNHNHSIIWINMRLIGRESIFRIHQFKKMS